MAFSIEITRPDDLLRLRIEGRNVRVDRGEGGASLSVEDVNRPAFLLVHFAPQAIAETAYYEAKAVAIEQDPTPGAPPPPAPPAGEIPAAPGSVPARLSHGSRLVFKLPAAAKIPLTIEGLLDWSGFELSVNGIAAIGDRPSPAQIASAPAIARPADTETAIELPYRLVISPTADVRWTHRRTPFTSRGRTELWHTRLQSPDTAGVMEELTEKNPASLRAIWSEDYNHGHGLKPNKEDPELVRAAMTPNDRHQIVIKTSAFHGYEGETTLKLGGLVVLGGSSSFGSGGIEFKHWRSYVPQPFHADQLMLSSLGGWLRSQGHWPVVRKVATKFPFGAFEVGDVFNHLTQAPRGAMNIDHIGRTEPGPRNPPAISFRSEWIEALKPTAPEETLDLSEWQHVATQGRDHYVRIVYEGELLPFHNRASLVKVTERKFKEDSSGRIVANLYQRNFIIVREPEKIFGSSDRGMPFKKIRLTTVVTPDLAPPTLVFSTTRTFWVEVYTAPPGTKARFPFHAVGTDIAGNNVDFTIPMLFASRADDDKRAAIITAYNDSKDSATIAARSAKFPGQKVRYAADDDGEPSENALLATRGMTFALDGETPFMLKADVNVPQVQELLGKDAPTAIRLYPAFVENGLDTGSGVFAEVVRETPNTSDDPFAAVTQTTLGVTFSSDKAGGFATPNMGVSTLTQRAGPLAGNATDAAADKFDPASFFPKGPGAALLFGTFELADLLLSGPITRGAPLMQTHPEEVAGVKKLVTTLEWIADVDNRSLPPAPATTIAEFKKKNDSTHLVVHGRIEKVIFDPAGDPAKQEPTSSFDGKLNDFSVILLRSVEVKFVEFTFSSKTGQKPVIGVKLDQEHPLTFTGDLQFVEELRKAIPPDLFGDVSIDVLPGAIRAGFSFTLPPINVGVFSLKDVSLGTGLTLPFLDGRPSLDFNVSERPRPFLLAVGIFGGGGFFHLQLDTAGLKIVEAALEFGVTASVDLGVASGGVHIMAGIYFKLERKQPSNELMPMLTGYLRMGGQLSVLGLIKLSLEFTLSFTYDSSRDKAYGRATLTVQVEVAFFSVSVEIIVERAFGGSGDPLFKQLFTTAQPWRDYAEAFA